jgi:OmcA/MtrC family decaheme c-type cytochrome
VAVDDANCESCHANLALHGGGRTNPQYCNTCHNPARVDIAVPAESVHFKWMIHKIHRGEDLEKGYVVTRSRGTFDFSEVDYPGDLRNCEKCHVNDSYLLPLPDDLLPTTTSKALWEPMQPTAAACLSCHDSDDTASHAFANTTIFGESCATCHGEGMTFAVEKVHAR